MGDVKMREPNIDLLYKPGRKIGSLPGFWGLEWDVKKMLEELVAERGNVGARLFVRDNHNNDRRMIDYINVMV